jgi:hypothetical protein
MNNLLQRCVDELKKDKPELQYVIGILETLIVIQDVKSIPEILTHSSVHKTALAVSNDVGIPMKVNGEMNDEASLLDAKAKAMMSRIPPSIDV